MPIYEFESEDGERREEFFSIAEAPEVGTWVELGGKAYQRIVSSFATRAPSEQQNYRLHSNAAPLLSTIEREERRARAGRGEMPVRAPAYDEHGRAVFRSEKELRDYAAKDGRYVVGSREQAVENAVQAQETSKKAQKTLLKETERKARLTRI